jgi:diguanylate cyclase (GGDEF)-like protein/PAS domain S-box-containing protein
MAWEYSPYSLILAVGAGICIFVAVSALRRPVIAGSLPLALFMLAVSEGALGYAIEYSIVGIPAKVLMSQIEYIGGVTGPVFFFLFVLEYTQIDKGLKPWHTLLLWVIPLLTLGFAWTNELHHLVWSSFTPAPQNMLIYGHGAWFWVYGAYDYILVAAGTIVLVRYMIRQHKVFRSQITAVIIAILLPISANAIYAAGLSPLPGLDMAPAVLAFTGVILAYSIFRFELLDLSPVARDVLIDDMSDGVIVLDLQNRIADINPAAKVMLVMDHAPIGEYINDYLQAWPKLLAEYGKVEKIHTEICMSVDPPFYLDLHISPLLNRRKQVVGKLVIVRDVTSLKVSQQAEKLSRQRLDEILETAPNSIVIVDKDGLISYANRSTEQTLGLPRTSLIGLPYNTLAWKMTTPDGNPIQDEELPFVQIMESAEPIFGVELAATHPSGERLILSVNAAPIREMDGSAGGMVAAFEDITKRRRTQLMVAQKAEELAILNRINLAITNGLDFNHVLRTLHEQILQVVSCDVFYVALYDEKTGMIDIPLYFEGEYRPGPLLNFYTNPGMTGYILASRRTLYLPDTLDETSPPPMPLIRTGGKVALSYVGIPLFLRDKVIGVMSVQSYRRAAYNGDQVRLLENIAIQAALAIENARLYSEVQRMSIIDKLTDTYNYRGLLELGAREVERARRFHHPLTALFFDIDDFRNFNNLYSHSTGNQILVSVAACCRKVLRSVDIIARYGGDEFVILLSETDLATARKITRRLCREIAESKVVTDFGELGVTISAGLADLTDDIPDILTLMDHANEAEHIAKEKGNTVFVYDSSLHASGEPPKSTRHDK